MPTDGETLGFGQPIVNLFQFFSYFEQPMTLKIFLVLFFFCPRGRALLPWTIKSCKSGKGSQSLSAAWGFLRAFVKTVFESGFTLLIYKNS